MVPAFVDPPLAQVDGRASTNVCYGRNVRHRIRPANTEKSKNKTARTCAPDKGTSAWPGLRKSGDCSRRSPRRRARSIDGLARRGYQGQMAWMARDPAMRTDPRKLFPEARSVVVVAENYYTPAKHSDDPTTGKVSRYAWGDDYHEVVGSKLGSLLAWIKEEVPEAEGKSLRRHSTDDGQGLGGARRTGLDWQTHKSHYT